MGFREPLLGGAAAPFHRLSVILRNTSAIEIHATEIVLRPCIALFGGAAIPLHRFGIVPWDTLTLIVHKTAGDGVMVVFKGTVGVLREQK